MEKMGLVCRKKHKGPKDKQNISDRKGPADENEGEKVARQTVNDAFKGLDDKEISDVQRLMKMIFNNLK